MAAEITGVTPLFERVLILPDEIEKQTETGIIIPNDARKRPNTGIVVSVGHLVSKSGCPVKDGDRVLYLRYSGLDLAIGGVIHHLVMANDLVCIIDNNINATLELKDYAG